ncbi:hypothetical protein SAMN04487760_11153 [Lachnospiraceae bacterium G41]|nr:hypothetical protein SAMN04487760_11153 [Lachnospiraceae bacterium G41]
MLNYLFALIIYVSFIILIFALKINPKPNKKTIVLTIVIPLISLILQIVSEWILYICIYIFADIKSFYFTIGIIINIIELALPFITVLFIGKINGCKVTLQLVLAFAAIFVVLSFILKLIILSGDWQVYEDEYLTDSILNGSELDLLTTGKDLKILQNFLIVINIIPTVILEFLTIIKSLEKKNANLPKKTK